MLTQKKLKRILKYNRFTGDFIWAIAPPYHPSLIGKKAGCITSGYVVIRINGKAYRAHRLAWLYITGSFPKKDIDHADCNPANNAFSNLRECSNAQNQANKKSFNKRKMPKGVRQLREKFVARITFNKKQIHIGVFTTAAEASAAYLSKSVELYKNFARAA